MPATLPLPARLRAAATPLSPPLMLSAALVFTFSCATLSTVTRTPFAVSASVDLMRTVRSSSESLSEVSQPQNCMCVCVGWGGGGEKAVGVTLNQSTFQRTFHPHFPIRCREPPIPETTTNSFGAATTTFPMSFLFVCQVAGRRAGVFLFSFV